MDEETPSVNKVLDNTQKESEQVVPKKRSTTSKKKTTTVDNQLEGTAQSSDIIKPKRKYNSKKSNVANENIEGAAVDIPVPKKRVSRKKLDSNNPEEKSIQKVCQSLFLETIEDKLEKLKKFISNQKNTILNTKDFSLQELSTAAENTSMQRTEPVQSPLNANVSVQKPKRTYTRRKKINHNEIMETIPEEPNVSIPPVESISMRQPSLAPDVPIDVKEKKSKPRTKEASLQNTESEEPKKTRTYKRNTQKTKSLVASEIEPSVESEIEPSVASEIEPSVASEIEPSVKRSYTKTKKSASLNPEEETNNLEEGVVIKPSVKRGSRTRKTSSNVEES